MRYLKIFLITVLLILPAIPSAGYYRSGDVDIEVVSDYGGTFTTIPFKDFTSGRTRVIKRYLEAKKGENYSIVVKNNLNERIGVVIAVDGRNIITGKQSFLNNNETMYILEPYGSAKLEGWRTDQNTVHKFYFTDTTDSYSVKTFGDSSAMGVITAALFKEKEKPQIYFKEKSLRQKAPSPSAGAPSADSMKESKNESAGTGFGDGKYSPVIKVEFKPENIPFQKILVKYEWRDTLCKKGIIKCRSTKESNRLWNDDEYAPYPPGY